MQRAMGSLSGLVERRRWVVVGIWLAALIVAVPFSIKQTDHLTSGGFTVPGAGSSHADRALDGFDGVQRNRLAAVLAIGPRATDADVRSALERVQGGVGRGDNGELAPGAGSPPVQRSGDKRVVLVPLRLHGGEDQAADVASDLRRELGVGDRGPR